MAVAFGGRLWYTWLKSERRRENYAEQFVRMGVGLFDLRLCRLVLRGDVCRGERGSFCQPRLFGGAGLPHLRVRRVADRAVPVAGAGQPVAAVCGVGAVDQPDRICDRLCAGKNLPPKMVGLFGFAVPAGRLCLPAVFAAVGCRVRGGAAAGAPAGNEADPLAGHILLAVALAVLAVDMCVTVAALLKIKKQIRLLDEMEARIREVAEGLGKNLAAGATASASAAAKARAYSREELEELKARRAQREQERDKRAARFYRAFPDLQRLKDTDLPRKLRERREARRKSK